MTTPFTIVYVWRQTRLGASEGLNVLLTDLIRGLAECQVPVRLLTTGRHLTGLRDMLEMNHISADSVEIAEMTGGSLFLAFKDRWLEKRLRERGARLGVLARLKRSVRQGIERFIGWFLDLTLANALFKLLAGLAVFLLSGVVFPLLLLLLVVRKIARYLFRPVLRRIKPWLATVKGIILSVSLSERLYRIESQRFGQAVDRASFISSVFIPTAFEGSICSAITRKKKLIVFPDAVSLLYPTRFPGSEFQDLLLASMHESVSGADGIVCYSEFVRDRQLLRFFAKASDGKPVAVIPQGFFVEDEFGERPDFSDRSLRRFIFNYFPDYGPLSHVYFSEFSFIIYPTVDRPHKNTLTLLKAFESLLRERGRNIKLVLTSPGGVGDTLSFIRERKLHRDVLFVPALPIQVLNHLLERASVMVHPSLAEGGDVFNFSRAVSHGTPALLANIPVSREMFARNGFDEAVFGEWLFEPTDHTELAEKIDSILLGAWQPLPAQQRTLERLSAYRFSSMARRYNDVFQQLAAGNQEIY
jgi:hypothetical protein